MHLELDISLLRFLTMLTIVPIILIEVVGYSWHRFGEHLSYFGSSVSYKHWLHHEEYYPATDLRPKETEKYKNSGAWSWYIVGFLSWLAVFMLFPLRDVIPITIGGIFYGICVVEYFHRLYHRDDSWLHKYSWFQKLIKRHDIHHWAACNYGIVLFWMDRLFRTLRDDLPPKKEIIFPELNQTV